MRGFLLKVALVLLTTFAVSVGLAVTTGGSGPADPDDPAAASEAESATPPANVGSAPGSAAAEDLPAHLNPADRDDSTVATQVLGITVVQESGNQLADTGFEGTFVAFVGFGLILLGTGTRQATRQLIKIRT